MASNRSTANPTVSSRRPNLLAIIVSSLTVWFLYQNFEPTPLGADPDGLIITSRVRVVPAVELPPLLPDPSVDSFTDEAAAPSENTAGEDQEQARTAATARIVAANSRQTLLINLLLMERGLERMASVPTYSATFHKQERVDGEMLDAQVMKVKVRHDPFSIYMKWLVGDKGREVLYVDGEYDGEMLVKMGGLKGRFLPALKLNPTGGIAMSESRYPITKAGILGMTQEVLTHRRHDIGHPSNVHCTMFEDREFNERECYCFVLNFASANVSPVYRQSIVYVDREWCLPVKITNHTWAVDADDLTPDELNELTLVEDYAFTDVELDRKLADADFDRMNKKYRLRR